MISIGDKLNLHKSIITIPLIVFTITTLILSPLLVILSFSPVSAISAYDDIIQLETRGFYIANGSYNYTFDDLDDVKSQLSLCGANDLVSSFSGPNNQYAISSYTNSGVVSLKIFSTVASSNTSFFYFPTDSQDALNPRSVTWSETWYSADIVMDSGGGISCSAIGGWRGEPIAVITGSYKPIVSTFPIKVGVPDTFTDGYPTGYEGEIISSNPPTTTYPPENPLLSAEVSGKTVTYTASIDSLTAQEAYLFQISNPDADPATCESTSSCYLEYTNTSGNITYSEVTLASNEEKGITGGTYTRSTFTVTLLYDDVGDIEVTMVGYVTDGIAHAHLTVPVGTTGFVSTDEEQTTGVTCGIADIACWLSQGFNNLTASISGFFSNLISNLTNFFSNLLTGVSDFFTYLFVPDGDLASTQFTDWTNNATGISNILAISVNTIGSLAGTTCSSVTLPLPYVETDLTLPCLYTFYYNNLGALFTLYQVIVSGVIAYGVLLNIAKHAKGFKDPTEDKIEVLNL